MILTSNLVVYASVGVFTIQLLSHIIINPKSIQQEPTSDRADEMVENRGSRAMGIFAIVLVVINFISDSPGASGSNQTIALATALLASGFLMVAFTVEVYGGLSVFLFKMQEDCLNFSGLLLFSGLYFMVKAVPAPSSLQILILISTVTSWFIWIYYKIDYLAVVQRREWGAVGVSRRKYVEEGIANLFTATRNS